MNTLLIFAITVAIAVSAVPPNISKYLPNKEYVYEYESEALTGIPAASNHLAGIKVLANVHLQLKGAQKFLLVLRNVRICHVNEKLKVARGLLPVESGTACTPIEEPEIATVMQENLVKPIRFLWANGHVSLLQTDAADAYWSVNLKRGLLSMLHMNLQELEALPVMPEALLEVIKAAVPSAGQRTLSNYFRVMEKDIVGECETIYAIQEEPAQIPVLTVTKVRNFDSCITRPVFQNGVLAALDCHNCAQRLPLRSQAHIAYTLSGNRQEFVIRSAVQIGHFIFKPMNTIDGQAITFTKQKLVLADVPESASEIPLGKKRAQRDPFLFEMPSPITHMTRETPAGENVNEFVTLIEERINQAVALIGSPEVSLRAPDIVAEIVTALWKAPLPAVVEIINKVCVESNEEIAIKKRELVLDVLPMCGRPDIVPVLHKLIKENKISSTRAAFMVNVMALATEPAPFLIKELLELYPTFKTVDVQLARSIVLTAGALTNTLNKLYVSTAVPKEITIPARDMIVKAFKALLESASARNEKLLVLKALGNAGLAEFIPLLEPIIKDINAVPEVRAKAIYALRRVSHLAKHKIHQVCVPIVLTPEEPLEVRIAALLITAHTRPESGIFTMIAQQLARDPSVQFTNFAWTTMKAIAQSKLPCNRDISEAAAAAIREVYTNFPGYPISMLLNYEIIFSYIHHLGAEIALDLVTPGVSALPETIVTRVNAYFAKSLFNVLEVGVESKGLLTVLRNLFGPENQWMKVLEGKISLADIVSPLIDPSILNIEKIRTFWNSITERELTGLAADMYFKLFGHELRFITLDNQFIKEKIRELEGLEGTIISKLVAGVPFNIMKTIALANQAVVVPTPNGMPVSLNLTVITIVAAKGNVKVDGFSSLAQLMTGTPTVNINYEIEPKIVTTMSGSMCVELGLVAAATALRAKAHISTPMKGVLIAELPTSKIQLTSMVPTKAETVLKMEIKPVAIILKSFPKPAPNWFGIIATPLYNPDVILPISVELPVGRETLGVEAVIKGSYGMPISPLAPIRILCMPHELELIVRPAPGAPTSIELIAAYIIPGTPEAETIKKAVLAGESQPIRNSWFSSSSATPTIEFEPVHPDPSITSPIQRQLVICLQTKGQPSPKQIAAQATIIAAPSLAKIQADIQVGVKSASATPVIAKIETVITVPPVLITSAPVPTAPQEIAVIRVAYGPQGHTTEYVTLKTLYNVLHTTEMEYVKEAVINSMKDMYFEKVDTSYAPPTAYTRASRYSYPGYESVYAQPTRKPVKPLQLIMEIEYKPITVIPATVVPMLNMLNMMYYKVLELPSYYFFPKGGVTWAPIPYAPNKIHAVITTLPTTATIVMIMKMPTEFVVVHGIPLPFAGFFTPLNRFSIWPEHMKRFTGGPVFSGNCTVNGEHVKTFDHVSYNLPETTCETILAQDCTSKKLFMVTHVVSKTVPEKKEIKLYIGSDIIEIVPTSSWGAHAVEVKVNGAPKPIPEHTPVEIKGAANEVVGTIIKKGKMVHVIEKKLGLEIMTNCHLIHMHVPAWFSGQVCGMCGNYDTEKVGDVAGPNNEKYPSPGHAIVDYVIPSPTCDVAQLKEKFMSAVSGPSGSCAPRQETVYIEHTENNERLACFSERPVMVCPPSCRAVSQKSVEMPFHCLPADRPAAHELINRLSTGPLPPISDATMTIRKPVLNSPECQRPAY